MLDFSCGDFCLILFRIKCVWHEISRSIILLVFHKVLGILNSGFWLKLLGMMWGFARFCFNWCLGPLICVSNAVFVARKICLCYVTMFDFVITSFPCSCYVWFCTTWILGLFSFAGNLVFFFPWVSLAIMLVSGDGD